MMKQVEEGRSMVEMLGVLAIIGVLSIGGIAGYTMAMNRFHANEIIDTAAKVSIIAMSKQNCDAGGGSCASMKDVTERNNVAGVLDMYGFRDGEVMIDIFGVKKGTFNAIKSIAGNRFVGGGPESSRLFLNFERY